MTEPTPITRKLTTILAADAANYSGRMAADEVSTVQALRRSRALIDAEIEARGGRIANTSGDGLIAEFPSVIEAVRAAVSIQRSLRADPAVLPFRIGLHLGDVIVEGADLLGDGVNIAARLQESAPEGGIYASAQVVDHAKGRSAAEFRPLGPTRLKHLGDDIAVFGVLADGIAAPDDLDRVIPKIRQAPRGSAPDMDLRARIVGAPEPKAEPAPASEMSQGVSEPAPDPAREKFRKTARGYGFASGGLIFADLMAGPGPGWPLLGVAILGGLLYRKWKAFPPAPE